MAKFFKRLLLLICVAAATGGGWYWWKTEQVRIAENALPGGIVFGNGRIEAVLVDVSAKYAGRVTDITVHEGDMVTTGQRLAQVDTDELNATLDKSLAQKAEAEEFLAEARADIVRYENELDLAIKNLGRATKLIASNAVSRQEYDTTKAKARTADAVLKVATAHKRTAERAIEAVEAEVKRVKTQVDEFTLTSTINGRVLYRLVEEGEVLGAGGKVLTLLDLSDIYMEIFLPSDLATQLSIHAEARIALDFAPEYTIPATVTFVSPEAQFTPKQVETMKERDKLMFRVKVQIPPELVQQHIEKVKTGVRGVAYVKMDENLSWPDRLNQRFPEAITSDAEKSASGTDQDSLGPESKVLTASATSQP